MRRHSGDGGAWQQIFAWMGGVLPLSAEAVQVVKTDEISVEHMVWKLQFRGQAYLRGWAATAGWGDAV